MEIKTISGGVTAAIGFKAAGAVCGLKKSGGADIALVVANPPAKARCLFTTNTVKAAPILVSEKNAVAKNIGALIINSGNANACTGEKGIKDAVEMCEQTKQALEFTDEKVLVASTGIIGVPLPMDKVLMGIETAASKLSADGGRAAAEAIMTTDTIPKESAVEVAVGRKSIRIGGMAKGAGMIAPDLATMIAVITTDADICAKALDQAVKEAVDVSFNSITIDGDMSTNDMVAVLANGAAGNTHILKDTKGYGSFADGLTVVMSDLAEQMVRDGEAATKFIKVTVAGAATPAEAKLAAKAIAESVLVKCAFFGGDANWGRIAAAAGNSAAGFNAADMDISINNIKILADGAPVSRNQKAVDAAMRGTDIEVIVELKAGQAAATVLTTDMSTEYVKFNAHYRT
ncbi:MAG: bifunctional glutamate N-acetyltransferase/amino-acid acetyltransferase ArgJ [Actinomycetota bacterium]